MSNRFSDLRDNDLGRQCGNFFPGRDKCQQGARLVTHSKVSHGEENRENGREKETERDGTTQVRVGFFLPSNVHRTIHEASTCDDQRSAGKNVTL